MLRGDILCYSSRAVHVDLSTDYSPDAFLQTEDLFVLGDGLGEFVVIMVRS